MFDDNMLFSGSKEAFLCNEYNKQCFITVLRQALVENGFETMHAKGDADCLIVKSVLRKFEAEPVILLGEDTDLLVLLLYHLKHYLVTVMFS